VLLQRTFLETYGFELTETTIEDWVDGAILPLSNLNRRLSPYSRVLYKPKKEWKEIIGEGFYGHVSTNEFIDIGTPERHEKAERLLGG